MTAAAGDRVRFAVVRLDETGELAEVLAWYDSLGQALEHAAEDTEWAAEHDPTGRYEVYSLAPTLESP